LADKITDKDYLFLSALLKAREARMLGQDGVERMLSAPSYEEAAKLLTECGYEDMSDCNASQVDAALARRRKAVFDEIIFSAPDSAPVDVFRAKYDYHNIKVLVKARGAGVGGEHLFSDAGRVAREALIAAYDEEDYRFLPASVGEAMRQGRSILARTGNPQLADFAVDRLYFAEIGQLAERCGNEFLKEYVRVLVDSANLRTAVRTVRMNKDQEFLAQALVPGGSISPERMTQAAFSGGDALAQMFTASPLKEAAALGAEAMRGGPMTAFELSCDNGVSACLASAKTKPFGVEPVVEYLALLECEMTAVRMTLAGRLGGIPADTIRERLRDIYV